MTWSNGRSKHRVFWYSHLRQAVHSKALLASIDKNLGYLRRRHTPRPRQVLHRLQRRLRRRYRRCCFLLIHLNAKSTSNIPCLPASLHGHPRREGGSEAHSKHKEGGVEPPAMLWQAERTKGNTRLTGICSQQLSYLRPWRVHDMDVKRPGDSSMVVGVGVLNAETQLRKDRTSHHHHHAAVVNNKFEEIFLSLYAMVCVSRPAKQQ